MISGNELLSQFPSKATPVGADLLYCGNSSSDFNEVKITINTLPINISQLIGALPASRGGSGRTDLVLNGIPIANSAGAFIFLDPLENGQLIIGSTGSSPLAASLTAGSNITITNSPGQIVLSASGTQGSGQFLGIKFFTFNTTYTPSANARSAFVILTSGGGGGAGCNGSNTAGGNGGVTSYVSGSLTLTVSGGFGAGSNGKGGPGGFPTYFANVFGVGGGSGNGGIQSATLAQNYGGCGGSTMFGGAGGSPIFQQNGNNGKPFTGGGGSGAGDPLQTGNYLPAGGGGGGGTLMYYIPNVAVSTLTVGQGGSAGSGGQNGGMGGSGNIIIIEYS
jgi:hypothetical protein